MHLNTSNKLENTPSFQVMYLFIFALLGVFLFAVLGFASVFLIFGYDVFKGVLSGSIANISAYKVVLVAQQIGLFLTPAILLSVIEAKKLNGFYQLNKPKIQLLLTVALLSVVWMPLMGLANEWNKNVVLPESLAQIDKWMRTMEDQAAVVTKQLLTMHNASDLLINLLVIAIVPAICEEFLFRGAIQRIFFRINANPHVAIWLSAFIFSFIHFQFFGFLPRMLLGAAFGYIYFWSGSLWYAIFAHFLNNAYAVCVAFYLQLNNKDFINADDTTVSWYGYLISFVLTAMLFNVVRLTKKFKVQ